jgi:hypothetical protein
MEDDQTPFLTPERGFLLFGGYENLETVYPQISQKIKKKGMME